VLQQHEGTWFMLRSSEKV